MNTGQSFSSDGQQPTASGKTKGSKRTPRQSPAAALSSSSRTPPANSPATGSKGATRAVDPARPRMNEAGRVNAISELLRGAGGDQGPGNGEGRNRNVPKRTESDPKRNGSGEKGTFADGADGADGADAKYQRNSEPDIPDHARPGYDWDALAPAGERAGGAESDDAGEDAGEPDPAAERRKAEARKAKTIKELAEALEISPKKLYDMEVATGDGETVSIGALKDAWSERATASRESEHRKLELDKRESALAREQQLFGQMALEVRQTGRMTPETQKRAEQAQQMQQARQREMMLRVIPELADSAKLDGFREQVVKGLAEYGYGPHELNMSDHRMIWFIRDALRNKARLAKLDSWTPPAKEPPKAQAPGRRAVSPDKAGQVITRARNGSDQQKAQAISQLISKRKR